MYDVVIVHGSFGNPYENWFPWLYASLASMEKKVLVPDFPTPEGQTLESWMSILNSYDKFIGEQTVIIAHSISPAFIADYVLLNKKNIKGLIAVAPFYGLINIKEFDDINASFFLNDFPLDNLPEYIENIHSIYSDDDPYVPIALTESFVKQTGSNKTIIPKGKHLNSSSGFTEFSELLEVYKNMK